MEKQWYMLQVYVGYEHRIKATLQQKFRETGQEGAIGDVVVPTEKVVDLVRGKKRTIEKRLFPGYILMQMTLTERTWHFVHSVPRVVGFVGESETHPIPLREEEVQTILKQMETGMATPRPRMLFVIGEKVKVVDGPFRDFVGTVESVKPERSRVRVAVSVFGRPTPIELDFIQVEAA
jgi:transcriptional antiterminator NusG